MAPLVMFTSRLLQQKKTVEISRKSNGDIDFRFCWPNQIRKILIFVFVGLTKYESEEENQ